MDSITTATDTITKTPSFLDPHGSDADRSAGAIAADGFGQLIGSKRRTFIPNRKSRSQQ